MKSWANTGFFWFVDSSENLKYIVGWTPKEHIFQHIWQNRVGKNPLSKLTKPSVWVTMSLLQMKNVLTKTAWMQLSISFWNRQHILTDSCLDNSVELMQICGMFAFCHICIFWAENFYPALLLSSNLASSNLTYCVVMGKSLHTSLSITWKQYTVGSLVSSHPYDVLNICGSWTSLVPWPRLPYESDIFFCCSLGNSVLSHCSDILV